MKISDILNPSRAMAGRESTGKLDPLTTTSTRLASPPLSPHCPGAPPAVNNGNYGKPRNRFSEYEDAVICQGVAKGLTWGQISGQLPHRKRATCFNRYRTLQGIRKSRKIKAMLHQRHYYQDAFFTPSPSPPPPLTPPESAPCIRHSNDLSASNSRVSRSNNHLNYGSERDTDILGRTSSSTFFGIPHHWSSAWSPSAAAAAAVNHEKHHHRYIYERY